SAATEFTLPLGTAQIHSALTSALTDDGATVTLQWAPVPEAEHYAIAYRPTGAPEFTEVSTGLTEPEADVPGLTPAQAYEFQVTTTRGEEITVSAPHEVTVAEAVE